MEISYYNSPVGILEIICKNDALTSLKFVKYAKKSDNETLLLKTIKSQLDEYFLGKRCNFDLKINPEGTVFQKLVWKALQKIPFGKTKSYSEIAEIIGNKKAQRAVGSACNKNPIMIIIPCHRIVLKNGRLGEYIFGSDIKAKLLEIESIYLN